MIVVVGYGNSLRGDDGVAWRIVGQLERAHDPVVPLALHQLTPEVALVLKQADGVIFVDAAAGPRPGNVAQTSLTARAGQPGLTHQMGPEAVLALTEALYGSHPRAVLVTVAGEHFGLSDELSPVVARALPRALRLIRELVRAWSPDAPATGALLALPRHGDA